MVLQVAIGSTNPVKATAASDGLAQASGQEVKCHTFSVDSSVPDQPVGEKETALGAKTRAKNAWSAYVEKNRTNPSLSVGFEGGITSMDVNSMEVFGSVCLYDGKHFGTSNTASFPLPSTISMLVKEGLELGDACNKVFNAVNIKQTEGVVGRLTKGVIDRAEFNKQAVILAYVRFNFPELYDVDLN